MTADLERRAYALFREAGDLDAAARARLLDAACAGDAALRAEVESLLAARADVGSFLERPAPAALGEAPPPELEPGTSVGAYRVVRAIGRGSSGTVYEAEQARPRRRVALKVMRARLRSEDARRRFLDEAEVLARLDHDAIARILEAGVHAHASGEVPFVALEFVEEGRPVTRHARDHSLAARERCALVVAAADAVHHAHQKGVIHRDLNPANVLVDARGRVKVIDFGIAREVGAGRAPPGLAGTVAYMSPEQAAGLDLDVRSDVHALGAILFELLADRPLHDVADLPLDAALEQVRAGAPADAAFGLGRDLAAIVRRALATDRERRYASAAALGDDLRRWAEHRPVEAVAGGILYHAAKFARRERFTFAALCAVVVVSTGAAIVGVRLANREERLRREAEMRAYVASVAAASSAVQLEDVAAARAHLDRAPERLRNWEWRQLDGVLDTSERTIRWATGLRTATIDRAGRRLALSGTGSDPQESGVRALDAESGAILWAFGERGPRADALAFSPDGTVLAVGYVTGSLELRNAATGELTRTLAGHGAPGAKNRERHVNDIVFELGGAWFASGAADGTVRVWDTETGRELRTLEPPGARIVCLALAPHGSKLVGGTAGATEGEVVVWDLASGAIARRIGGHARSVDGVAVSPSGTRIVSSSRDHSARLLDFESGELIAAVAVHAGNVRDVAFSPSGEHFATASWDRTVALFRTSDGTQVARLRGHTDWVERVEFLPDERRVVSFARDGSVKTWRVDAAHGIPCVRSSGDSIACAVTDPGGRRLVTATTPFGARLQVWDLERRTPIAACRRGVAGPASIVVWPDATRFATGDPRVRVEVRSMDATAALPGPAGACGPLALARDGAFLYATTEDGRRLAAWRTDTWELERSWDAGGMVLAAAIDDDGRTLFTSTDAGEITAWSAAGGRRIARTAAQDRAPARLAVAPASGVLFAWGPASSVRLLDPATLEPVGALPGTESGVNALAFSSDGSRLFTAGRDAMVRVWDAESREQVAVLDARPEPAYCLAFAGREATLVCGGGVMETFGEIRVWSAPDRAASRR